MNSDSEIDVKSQLSGPVHSSYISADAVPIANSYHFVPHNLALDKL